LADLGNVGREVLGTDRREHGADEIPLGVLDLGLEHADAAVAPGVVHADRIELLPFRLTQEQRHGARPHRCRDVGAEEVWHEGAGGQFAVAIIRRKENRVPLVELGCDRQRLGGQRDSGQNVALVALDHLLRLAHRIGRITAGVLDQRLDRPA